MEQKVLLNAFADHILLEQADRDYISARVNCRLELREQFLWSSLQTCEKYLKAILLYNGRSARFHPFKPGSEKNSGKELGHNLDRLFQAVRTISDLPLRRPVWLPKFLHYLTTYGNNRYLTRATHTRGGELQKLDEAVWTLRQLCQDFDWSVPEPDGSEKNLRKLLIKRATAPRDHDKPLADQVSGLLGQVLKRSEKDLARQALIWNNPVFCDVPGIRVELKPKSTSENPPPTRDWFKSKERLAIEPYFRLD
jgi:hypothetical protein